MSTERSAALGDLTEILSGYAFDSSLFTSDTGIQIVRIRDVLEGHSSTFYRGNYDDRFIVNDGDILIGMDGEFNRARWRGGEALLNQRVCKISSSSSVLDEKYLYHFLPQALKKIEDVTPYVTVKHLSAKQIAGISIPLPPLSEQKRIAAILDKADELRAARRAAIAKLDELGQAIFLEMFGDPTTNPKGWPVYELGNCINDVTNGMTRRREEVDMGENIVLRLRDIRDGWIDFSDTNRITLSQSEKKKYVLQQGNLLFIRVNGNPDYVGRCALFTGYSEPIFFNDHVMRVQTDTSVINGHYLVHILNSPHGKREISIRRKTSAGQHTINQEGLSRIRIPLPPIGTQNEFANRLDLMNRNKAIHRASLAQLDALFASLQHRAFQGEL